MTASSTRPIELGDYEALKRSGCFQKIAAQMGVKAGHVSAVARGKNVSSRVFHALRSEIQRISRQVPSKALPAKPRIVLHFHSDIGGDIWATSPGHPHAPVQIGRTRVDAPCVPKYIPLIEVAKALDVSRDTVVRMIRDGVLRGYRTSAKGWWRVTAESFGQYHAGLQPLSSAHGIHINPPAIDFAYLRKRRNAVPEPLPRTTQTASQVARRLQTSPQTVGRLIQDGKLKGYKLREGGQWHISISSVESLEAERIGLFHGSAEAAS